MAWDHSKVGEQVEALVESAHTPREISQQPTSWWKTFRIFEERQTDLRSFLTKACLDPTKSAGIDQLHDHRPLDA